MLIVALILFTCTQGISARECGFPDRSNYSSVSPEYNSYFENEQVTYKCQPGYYMVRESQPIRELNRTCQCNGVWSERVPGCDFRDFIKKNSDPTRNLYSQALDEDDKTFYSLAFHGDQYDMDINLDVIQSQSNELLVWVLYEIIGSQSEIKVKLFDGYSTSECYPLNNRITANTKNNFTVSCELRHFQYPPQTLKLELTRENALQTVNIRIYTLRALCRITHECGTPDKLLNGNLTRNTDRTTYFCDPGYTLLGNSTSTCTRIDGNNYWHNGRTPICVSNKENNCRQLPEVKYGVLTFAKPTCPSDYNIHDYSDIAVLQCNSGFFSETTNNLLYCNKSTGWTWRIDGKIFKGTNACLPLVKSTTLTTAVSSFTTTPDVPNASTKSTYSTQNCAVFIIPLAVTAGVTIFILLYCLYRCLRKKNGPTRTKTHEDPMDAHLPRTSKAAKYCSEDLPLDVLHGKTCTATSAIDGFGIYEEIHEPLTKNQPDALEHSLQQNPVYDNLTTNRPDGQHDERSACEGYYENVAPLYSNIVIN